MIKSDPWAGVIEFPDSAGKFATADIDPRVHALEDSADKQLQIRRMFDEESQERAPEGTDFDSLPLTSAAKTIGAVQLRDQLGLMPARKTSSEQLDELGLHEPTPSKGRMERLKEGWERFQQGLREGMLEDIESNPATITARRIGQVGGKIVEGVKEGVKQTYGAIEKMERGPIEPQDVIEPVKQLFGGGAMQSIGAAEKFGVNQLGAFAKSGRHLTFGPRLKEHVDIKTNFPEADFWIIRRGDPAQLGKPTREYHPSHIGIRSRNHNVLPDYLYYAFQAAHGQGNFRQFATGATRLQHLRLQDVENLSLGQIMRGRGETYVGAFGGKKPKITALVDSLRGREEFEALSDEIYRLFTNHRNEIVPAAHELAAELAAKDPKLFDMITRLTEGTSHQVISEMAEQIAARQIYEGMLGTSDFDLGAFGGRGPGGRIELEDVRDIAKRLKVSFKDEGQGAKGTQYASLRRYDKGGKLSARVRIPSETARKGRDAGRRHYPEEIMFDTSDAPVGKRWGEADRSLVENASGGRFSNKVNLERALKFLFARGSKDDPNFLISPQDRPYIYQPKPEPVEPIGVPPEQGSFDWDSVLEF